MSHHRGTVANATNASTVTTNANLTGPVTSVGNATTITDGAVTNTKLANNSITVQWFSYTIRRLGNDNPATSDNGWCYDINCNHLFGWGDGEFTCDGRRLYHNW
jgi:hypothetical protein